MVSNISDSAKVMMGRLQGRGIMARAEVRVRQENRRESAILRAKDNIHQKRAKLDSQVVAEQNKKNCNKEKLFALRLKRTGYELLLNSDRNVILSKEGIGGNIGTPISIDNAILILTNLKNYFIPNAANLPVPPSTIKQLGQELEAVLLKAKGDGRESEVMDLLLDVYRFTKYNYTNIDKDTIPTFDLTMACALKEHIFSNKEYVFQDVPCEHLDYTPGRKDIQRLSVTFPGNRLTRTPAKTFTSNKDVLAEHARDRFANHENIIRNILQTAVIAQHSPTPQAAPLSITEEDAFITLLYLEDKTMQTVRQLGYQPGKIALDFRNCPQDITANLRLWGQQQSHNILTGKYTGQLQQNIAKAFGIVMDSASAPEPDPLEVEEKFGFEATPQPSAPTYPDIPPPYRAPTPPPNYYATSQATFTAVVTQASPRVAPLLPPKPEAWTARAAAQPESGRFTPPPK